MTIDDRLLKVLGKLARARKITGRHSFAMRSKPETRRQLIRTEDVRHAEGYARKPVVSGEFDIWMSEQDWGPIVKSG